MKRLVAAVLLLVLPFMAYGADSCGLLARYKVFSNARVFPESGDVGGYELAVQQTSTDSYKALLYVYEGAPNEESIPLTGTRKGAEVYFEGDWHEDLIEYPGKRTVSQTRHIKMNGNLSRRSFRGVLQIENDSTPVSLRSVRNIWLCAP